MRTAKMGNGKISRMTWTLNDHDEHHVTPIKAFWGCSNFGVPEVRCLT